MFFEEPKVSFIQVDNNQIMTANSCTSNANANPDMQVCSTGSAHEGACADEAYDWVD